MFKDKWIVKNIINENEINDIKNLVFKEANVKDLESLSQFIDNKSIDINDYYVKIKKDLKYINLEETIKNRLETNFNIKLKTFPVKGIRVVISSNKTQALWHQDEGTWAHHKTLSNQKPFTCWIPI